MVAFQIFPLQTIGFPSVAWRWVWDTLQIQTTVLQGNFRFQTNRYLYNFTKARYTIEFPRKLKEIVGLMGNLVLKLSFKSLDRNEYAVVNRGKKFLYFVDQSRSWTEAENACLKLGGHLASILSLSEKQTLDNHKIHKEGFLGGRKINGMWTWSDGSPFKDDIWTLVDKDRLHSGNCLLYNPPFIETTECSANLTSWCKLESTKISGEANVSFKYSANELAEDTPWLIVDHHLSENNDVPEIIQTNEESWFHLEWYIEGGTKDYELRSCASSGSIKLPVEVPDNDQLSRYTIKLDTDAWVISTSMDVPVNHDLQTIANTDDDLCADNTGNNWMIVAV